MKNVEVYAGQSKFRIFYSDYKPGSCPSIKLEGIELIYGSYLDLLKIDQVQMELKVIAEVRVKEIDN